jgi:hypothetical protein
MFRPIARTTDSCRPHRSRVKRGGRPKVWGQGGLPEFKQVQVESQIKRFFKVCVFLSSGVEVPSCGQAPPCPDTRGGVTKVEESTAPS